MKSIAAGAKAFLANLKEKGRAYRNRCRHPNMETVFNDGACSVRSCPDCSHEVIYGR